MAILHVYQQIFPSNSSPVNFEEMWGIRGVCILRNRKIFPVSRSTCGNLDSLEAGSMRSSRYRGYVSHQLMDNSPARPTSALAPLYRWGSGSSEDSRIWWRTSVTPAGGWDLNPRPPDCTPRPFSTTLGTVPILRNSSQGIYLPPLLGRYEGGCCHKWWN